MNSKVAGILVTGEGVRLGIRGETTKDSLLWAKRHERLVRQFKEAYFFMQDLSPSVVLHVLKRFSKGSLSQHQS